MCVAERIKLFCFGVYNITFVIATKTVTNSMFGDSSVIGPHCSCEAAVTADRSALLSQEQKYGFLLPLTSIVSISM
jgi:hypothetical protein